MSDHSLAPDEGHDAWINESTSFPGEETDDSVRSSACEEAKTLGDRRAARRGRKALDSTPDWFGCGRTITTESWNKFVAAHKAYYTKLDETNLSGVLCGKAGNPLSLSGTKDGSDKFHALPAQKLGLSPQAEAEEAVPREGQATCEAVAVNVARSSAIPDNFPVPVLAEPSEKQLSTRVERAEGEARESTDIPGRIADFRGRENNLSGGVENALTNTNSGRRNVDCGEPSQSERAYVEAAMQPQSRSSDLPAQSIPQDADESLADWYRERDRIQNEHDEEQRAWAEQERLQAATDDGEKVEDL